MGVFLAFKATFAVVLMEQLNLKWGLRADPEQSGAWIESVPPAVTSVSRDKPGVQPGPAHYCWRHRFRSLSLCLKSTLTGVC